MKKLLNLHGLLGHANNFNYRVLKSYFADKIDIVSPQVDYLQDPNKIIEELSDFEFDCIVANSFGGFFGCVLSSLFKKPAILCNPCIPPSDYILTLVPNYKYVKELERIWDSNHISSASIISILGDNDDIIDPYTTAYLMHINNKPIYTVDEGHKLSSPTFEYILKYEVSKCLGI